MDERLERNVRTGLASLLDPIAESHPRWATSPAAERVLGAPDRSRRSGRVTLLWAAVLVGLLVLGAAAAALYVGAQLERDEGVLVLAASPTPPATASPTPPAAAAAPAGTDILATTKAGPLPAAATCPPGTDPDNPGPADQERPIRQFAYGQPLAFDRRAGKIVLLDDTWATWTFDVCTNTWAQMHPDEVPARGWGMARLAYDADSDRTIALVERETVAQTWIYEVTADRWSQGHPPPFGRPAGGRSVGMVYDPVSGLVVVRQNNIGQLWAYDVDADRWTQVAQGWAKPRTQRISGLADRQVLGYDAAADRLILWIDEEPAWTFDPRTSAWSQDDTDGPPLWYAWFGSSSASAFDEVFGHTLFVSAGHRRTSGVIAYDATRHTWDTLSTDSPCIDSAVVYDAVNDRIVCDSSGGGMLEDGVTSDSFEPLPRGMVAFDAVERRWVTLLEPISRPSASPSRSPSVSPDQ